MILLASLIAVTSTSGIRAARPDVKTVTLRFLGHSAFQIISPKGHRIVIDPYASNEWPGLSFPPVHADHVLISHPHWDHDSLKGVMGKPKPIRGPGTLDKADIVVTRLSGRHAHIGGEAINHENIVTVIETGGLRFCHLGDNGPVWVSPGLPGAILADGAIDVLMIAIDAEKRVLTYDEADAWIEALSPRVVIPMHYKIPSISLDRITGLGTIDEWLASRPDAMEVRILETDSLIISTDDARLPPAGARQARVLTLTGQDLPSSDPGGGTLAARAAKEAADIALAEGDITTAMDQLVEATRSDPSDIEALQKLGFLYLASSRPDRAHETLGRCGALAERPSEDPDDAMKAHASLCWLGAGMALDLLGRRDEAITAYEKVVALGINDELQIDNARRYLESPYEED